MLTNPAIGHQIEFLDSSPLAAQQLLRLRYSVPRPEHKPRIPRHYHHVSSERFVVETGTLGVEMAGARRLLQAGEAVTIGPGVLHTFWNAGRQPMAFVTEITPPGCFRSYFETVFGLAQEGRVNRNGLPGLLQLMVVAEIADSYTPELPLAVWRRIIPPMARLGRWFGYSTR